MSKKRAAGSSGIVYSTDPHFKMDDGKLDPSVDLSPSQQKLKIKLDTRQRAGKAVTLIQEYVGSNETLDELGKKLKAFCGTGGSVKDRTIIIQGDQRDKVLQWLLKHDFKQSKKV
jgi:translation initiation factor 1